jgi:hypothetical protein
MERVGSSVRQRRQDFAAMQHDAIAMQEPSDQHGVRRADMIFLHERGAEAIDACLACFSAPETSP